eukprot:2647850-Rhodomonas_salina.1
MAVQIRSLSLTLRLHLAPKLTRAVDPRPLLSAPSALNPLTFGYRRPLSSCALPGTDWAVLRRLSGTELGSAAAIRW